MKVLHVIPSAEVAGVEIFTSRLASAQSRYHDVAILTPPGPVVERYLTADLECHYTETRSPGVRELAAGMQKARRGTGRVDIVHVHSAAEHCRAARRTFSEAGIVFRCSGNFGVGFWLASRALNWWSDIVVANSTSDHRSFIRAGLDRSKLRLIHNGVPTLEPSRDGPSAVATRLGLKPQEDVIVVSLARLARAKGLDVLLHAAKLLEPDFPNLRIVLAGTGPEAGRLKALVERLGLLEMVRLPGLIVEQADLLAIADMYAHPARHEPFPNAILEAMSMGLPVVASRVGGIVDQVVDGESGLLVPANDPSALATGLRQLLSDPELRRAMGEAALARQQSEYSIDAMLAGFASAYDHAIDLRSTR